MEALSPDRFVTLTTGLDWSSNPAVIVLLMLCLALVPFFILAFTSFVKLNVVFGILRNALGAQQVPSGAVTSLLSLVLTLQIMAPVIRESMANSSAVLDRLSQGTRAPTHSRQVSTGGGARASDLLPMLGAVRAGAEPFSAFLAKHAGQRERAFFCDMSRGSSSAEPIGRQESIFTLLPAFLISELHEAFAIGFLVYLPFLVVDLVVANILVGLGMLMVSPVSVSLPFKILLFVGCDGWFLLCRSLMLGYA